MMPATAFDRAIVWLLRPDVEGAYSDDPDDPGGETKYGISRRSYPALNIFHLSQSDAIAIYRRDFWVPLRCDDLPMALALVLFDGAVNQGSHAAAMCLQYALGFRGDDVDGVIGPATIGKARRTDPAGILAEFVARRAVRYSENPKCDRFGLGWFLRLAKCHQFATEFLSKTTESL